jgi:protein tyrosine phosphatase
LEDDPTLSSLSKEKYESMMPYIINNFELTKSLPIAEDYIYENYLKKMMV